MAMAMAQAGLMVDLDGAGADAANQETFPYVSSHCHSPSSTPSPTELYTSLDSCPTPHAPIRSVSPRAPDSPSPTNRLPCSLISPLAALPRTSHNLNSITTPHPSSCELQVRVQRPPPSTVPPPSSIRHPPWPQPRSRTGPPNSAPSSNKPNAASQPQKPAPSASRSSRLRKKPLQMAPRQTPTSSAPSLRARPPR